MAVFNQPKFLGGSFLFSAFNLATNAFKVMLTDQDPYNNSHQIYYDVIEIASGNGYTTGGTTTTLTFVSDLADNSTTVKATPVTFTAIGGPMLPFRYAVLYDVTTLYLLGWWDYGTSVTLNPADTFTVQFDTVGGVLKIS